MMRATESILLFALVFISSTFYGQVTLDVTNSENDVEDALALLCDTIRLAGLNMSTPNFDFLGSSDPGKYPLLPENDYANGTDKVTICYALFNEDCPPVQLGEEMPTPTSEFKVYEIPACWVDAQVPFWALITDPLQENSEIVIITNVQAETFHMTHSPAGCLNGYCNSNSGLDHPYPAGSTLAMVDFKEIAYFVEFPVLAEEGPQLVMQEYPGGTAPGPVTPLVNNIADLQCTFATDNDGDGELDDHNVDGHQGDPGDYIASPFLPPFSEEDIRAVRVQIEDNFCYTILSVPFSACANVPQSEIDAIIELYNSTTGDNWNYNMNWFEGSTCRCWFGVQCTNDRIRSLALFSNNMIGFLPQSLATLSGLQELLLSHNHLTGSIPLFNLTSASPMQAITLNSNNLSGTIPAGLFPFGSHLYRFTVQSNKLGGEIPAEILNCLHFEENGIDVRWNALYTDNEELRTFLNVYHINHEWESTQTVVPTHVTVGPASYTQVFFSWTPILFTEYTGGYEIYHSLHSGGPYAYYGMTSTKADSSIIVTGLAPGRTYYFVVRTVTYAHENNENTVYSEFSQELSASTLPSSINLLLQKSGPDIELEWAPNTDPNDILYTTSLDLPFGPLLTDVLSPEVHSGAAGNNEPHYFYVIAPQEGSVH